MTTGGMGQVPHEYVECDDEQTLREHIHAMHAVPTGAPIWGFTGSMHGWHETDHQQMTKAAEHAAREHAAGDPQDGAS